ncbi:HAD superfamily hydrolase (TIGR01509 family) [Knoellia remsis]|uniref:HAD superfamily hydrolase (TIGR01509 family) n=1 Tax=Knoellia remsis TaxID=407159 RepID=A0A2T0UAA7_9MICO|nr:HAD family hydrolase [Knoellia remsis]PRY54871.1 HAD superfamily hydrolase (TIGR01509 family) [Knoellia remsis]
MTLPAAVLWDMDGTLVDTEPYWIEAEHDIVEEHGGTWSDEYAHQLVGNDLMVSAQFIRDNSPITWEPERIIDELLLRVTKRVREHVPWRPGARELLAALLEQGVPNALVTMSWRSLAVAVVAALPEGTFAAVVTGDEVEHGKPHPEPYHAAARLLGVEPRNCVAIEDSPTGVRSAVAAGVPTIAVPHVVPVPVTRGAVQLPSLRGLTPADLTSVVADLRVTGDLRVEDEASRTLG